MPLREVRPVGPRDASCLIIGEAPGEEEDKKGVPFVGRSGQELSRLLTEAGIRRSDCYITNVFSRRPPGNDVKHYMPNSAKAAGEGARQIAGKWLTQEGASQLESFLADIKGLRPRVVVVLGNAALWALTGEWGITQWRGSLLWSELLQCRVIPTYHPAAILRQWPWRPIALHDLQRVKREIDGEGPREPDWEFTMRPSMEEVRAWIDEVMNQADAVARAHGPNGGDPDHTPASEMIGPHAARPSPVASYFPPHPPVSRTAAPSRPPRLHLSADIETRFGHIACIGIATSERRALCIPLMCTERVEGYWEEDEELEIVRLLHALFTHPAIALSGQNYLYDAQYTARHWGLVGNLAFDTMIAHHTLYSADVRRGLDMISSLYCEHYSYWKSEGKEWDPKKHNEDRLWRYNCLDACRTWEVAETLSREIDKQQMRPVFEQQMWQWRPILRMMLRGVRADDHERKRLWMEAMEGIAERQGYINRAVGRELNIASSKQMQELFYRELGCKEVRNRKTGRPSTDDASLQKIASRDPVLQPLIFTIQEIRTLNVLTSNVLAKGPDPDGRVRTSYDPTGTETYRWSSSTNAFGSGLNLQNITKGEKQKGGGRFTLPNLRRLFVPDPSMEMADVDLDRADVQIVAWDSDDEALKQKLRDSSRDLHTGNAADIFGVEYSRVTKFQRAFAKAFCHATNYGAGARTVAITLGQPIREIEAAQARWFAAHPGIQEWHERVEHDLFTTRTVRNPFGYRRIFLDRVEGLLPQALAWIPQCLTLENEVLTRDGWVKLSEIAETQEIMVWDAKTQTSYWGVPEKWHFGVSSDLYEDSVLGYTCTGNHRIPYTTPDNPDKVQWRYAKYLPKTCRVPCTTSFSGTGGYSKDWITLVTAFQADGFFDKRQGRTSASFQLRKEHKIERLRDCLGALKLDYKEYETARGETIFYIPHAEDLKGYKKLGSWLLDLSGEAMDHFLHEIEHWDGWRSPQGEVWFSSKIKRNCEWVATIAALRNQRARWLSTDERGENPVYRITIAPNKGKKSQPYFQKKEGVEEVACPTVSTGYFLVRSPSGVISMTGNSSVANIINVALCRMDEECGDLLEVLMQVHDSLVFQYPKRERARALAAARSCLEVVVPYEDPLVIPVGFEVSDVSWGHIEAVESGAA